MRSSPNVQIKLFLCTKYNIILNTSIHQTKANETPLVESNLLYESLERLKLVCPKVHLIFLLWMSNLANSVPPLAWGFCSASCSSNTVAHGGMMLIQIKAGRGGVANTLLAAFLCGLQSSTGHVIFWKGADMKSESKGRRLSKSSWLDV